MNQVIISIPNPEDDLDALHYEMWMLNNIRKSTFSTFSAERKQVIINSLLESFLVHARNLIDFLEKNKEQDDIVCSDFKDKNGDFINKIPVNLQSDMKIHMNKYVNHLTETRKSTKPAWKLHEIKQGINKSLEDFINQLSDQYFPTQGNKDRNSFLKLLT